MGGGIMGQDNVTDLEIFKKISETKVIFATNDNKLLSKSHITLYVDHGTVSAYRYIVSSIDPHDKLAYEALATLYAKTGLSMGYSYPDIRASLIAGTVNILTEKNLALLIQHLDHVFPSC
jgi:hypothetical protein